jgi:hypothetical protein
MGFTPAQVNAMGVWEFAACCDGFKSGERPKKLPDPTDAEYAALVEIGEMIDRKENAK